MEQSAAPITFSEQASARRIARLVVLFLMKNQSYAYNLDEMLGHTAIDHMSDEKLDAITSWLRADSRIRQRMNDRRWERAL